MSSPYQVVVSSDQQLLVETVAAALSDVGLDVARAIGWPPVIDRVPPGTVGVLLCSLGNPRCIAEARALVCNVGPSWIVVTGAPPGPLWGAMLGAGAVVVLPDDISLDRLLLAISQVAAGESPLGDREAHELLEAWRTAERDRRLLAAEVRSLSPRERFVLRRLHAGESVASIAAQAGVTTGTVRSQVRSILKKLGVRSQLAATAAYDAVRVELAETDEVPDAEEADERAPGTLVS